MSHRLLLKALWQNLITINRQIQTLVLLGLGTTEDHGK